LGRQSGLRPADVTAKTMRNGIVWLIWAGPGRGIATYVLLRRCYLFAPSAFGIMIWGGLRGGLSVAMALSLPGGSERDLLMAVTHSVVVLGLLVQGTILAWLLRKDAEVAPASVFEHKEPEDT
jgi:NhaP-type Na+/H+ or K+/H+ antiporter